MAYRTYDLKDGSRVYSAFYFGPDGRRLTERVCTVPPKSPKREHTRARQKAEALATEQRAAVRNRTWTDPKAKADPARTLTFGQLVQRFLDDYRSRAGRVDFYRERSRAWLRHIPAGTPIAVLTVLHVDTLKRARSRKVGPSTVRKDLVSLSTLFRWAIARGYAKENPASPEKVTRPSEPKQDRGYLTDEQERALVACCPPWLSQVVRWAIGTGMDRREVVTLSWAAVDERIGVVHAPRGKTGTDRRIPINATLRSILAGTRRVRSIHGGGRVFLDDQGQPLSTERVKTTLRRAYDRAGVEVKAPFKIFRHTFASRLVMAGVDAPTIARLLGHTTLAVTDAYMHMSPGHLHNAMERLEARQA